jgi:hypothetical protein
MSDYNRYEFVSMQIRSIRGVYAQYIDTRTCNRVGESIGAWRRTYLCARRYTELSEHFIRLIHHDC